MSGSRPSAVIDGKLDFQKRAGSTSCLRAFLFRAGVSTVFCNDFATGARPEDLSLCVSF
jgi:hypothetical protein